MPDFFVITDGDGTTAILPLSRLPADTTTGERVTIDVHATNGTAANQKAFMPESLPQGSTIRHVLTVADVAYSPSRAPLGPLHRASRQQRASAAASGKASTIACNSARVSSGLVGGVMCSGYGAVSSGARCSDIVYSFRATGGVCWYGVRIPAPASLCHPSALRSTPHAIPRPRPQASPLGTSPAPLAASACANERIHHASARARLPARSRVPQGAAAWRRQWGEGCTWQAEQIPLGAGCSARSPESERKRLDKIGGPADVGCGREPVLL